MLKQDHHKELSQLNNIFKDSSKFVHNTSMLWSFKYNGNGHHGYCNKKGQLKG